MKRILSALCMVILMLSGCTNIGQKVPVPTPQTVYRTLKIDENPQMYNYTDMENDLETLSLVYRDFTELKIIGKTYDNRNIYDMVIGSPDAKNHAVIHASIHAREYITSLLMVEQARNLHNNNLVKGGGIYDYFI